VSELSCDKIRERLVDYVDGELSERDAAEVQEHLGRCDRCRAAVDALRRSLDLARVIWTDAQEQLKTVKVHILPRSAWFLRPRAALAAACILLVITGSILWKHLSPSPTPTSRGPAETTLAEIKRTISRSAISIQLLASANILAEYPDGRAIAQEHYRYIVAAYPETDAAAKASAQLKSLSTRRTQL